MWAIARAARNTARLFGSQRKLWVPFLVVAFIELFLIGLIWLAPQHPFSILLAPPIRYFFGEKNLHYPWHLWFLYHVMKHTHFITTTFIGAYMGGIACAMVRQAHEGKPLFLRAAVASRQVRYGRMLLLWLLTWGIATGAIELVTRFAPKTHWMLWAVIGLSIALQALLSYVIPAAVYEGSVWWKAFFQGIREALRYPFSTVAVVILPTILVICFAAIAPETRVAQWMARATPEIALLWVGIRLVVWMVADVLLTVSLAHLWWAHRATNQVNQVTATVSQKAVSSTSGQQGTSAHAQEGPAVA